MIKGHWLHRLWFQDRVSTLFHVGDVILWAIHRCTCALRGIARWHWPGFLSLGGERNALGTFCHFQLGLGRNGRRYGRRNIHRFYLVSVGQHLGNEVIAPDRGRVTRGDLGLRTCLRWLIRWQMQWRSVRWHWYLLRRWVLWRKH